MKISDKSDVSNITSNSNNFEDINYAEIDGKFGLKENLFCFCNYIAYGNMIRCDNKIGVYTSFIKCKSEWFHFSCVGLASYPKGKWYCSPECAIVKKKKKNKL